MSTILDSRHALRGALVAAMAVGLHGVAACGSDTTSTGSGAPDASYIPAAGGFFGAGGVPGATGGVPGATGGAATGSGGAGGTTTGTGGTATGTGGSVGTGGARSVEAGPLPPDAPACVVPATLIDVSALPACDPTKFPGCTNAKCVAAAAVPAASRGLLADCTTGASGAEKCVPTYFIERNAKFIAATCRSVNDSEGRCLSQCIPQIAAQASLLQKATCAAGDLCAPCYDPRTGKDTGACTQGCDTGPKEAAKPFTKCCSGNGSCVPTNLVPTASAALLDRNTCAGTGVLCAPDKLSDPLYKAATCTSLAGAEGRCVADCVPSVAAQASRLPKASCDTGELCAPCYDPLTGLATGACTINGDQPTKAAVLFDKCCSDLGHCVPKSALTSTQQGQLAADTCTAASDLCAPDVFAVANKTADTCRALGSLNAEGRCVPTCVPSIQAQLTRLDLGTPPTCPANTLCAPCYDPVTGADTSACSQNGDKPKEGKKVFPSCCGGNGACVPTALVPSAQVSQLGPDVCTDPGVLCAPAALTDPTVKPKACTAPGNVEARCLPACLPALQLQKANLRQQTCAITELCAPCYNPLDGTDTGACRINGDLPGPKVVFAGCCPYPATGGTSRGTCVPPELVSASQATSLLKDSCGTGFLCAPNLKVADPTAKFKTCTNVSFACAFGCPGACVPDCIVDPAQRNLIAQTGTSPCAAGELCAPCIVPLTQQNTHACE
jgi:hypothetical protein